MLKIDDAYYLGKILKNSGLSGYFQVNLDTTHPEEYLEMESVFVELNGNLVPFFIGDVQLISGKKARIYFEDVAQNNQIFDLIGKDMYLPLNSLPKLSDTDFYFFEVEGFTCIDEQEGELGVVQEVIENPANPVIIILNAEGKEILVPKTEQTIKKISREEQKLWVVCPPGLLNIYLD